MDQGKKSFTRNFKEVLHAEQDYIEQRRKEIGLNDEQFNNLAREINKYTLKDHDKKLDISKTIGGDIRTIGLALSGGGIRSATFNLGLLQALAKREILPYCDYLSTVSGGGYIGSCLTSLLDNSDAHTTYSAFPLRFDRKASTAESSDTLQQDSAKDSSAFGKEREEVKWLRDHGNYLEISKNPFSTAFWRGIGLYLSGFVLVNFTTAWIVILTTYLLYQIIHSPSMPDPDVLARYLFRIGFAIFASMVLARGITSQKNPDLEGRKDISKFLGVLTWLSAMIAAAGGLILLALYLPNQRETANLLNSLLNGGIIGTLFGFLTGMIKTNNKKLHKLLGILFKISSLLLLPILLAIFIRWLWSNDAIFATAEGGFPRAILYAAILFILSLFVDVDRVSLHHFYRDRLSETYIFKRIKEKVKKGEEWREPNETKKLKDMHDTKNGAPYHLINATLNIPSTEDITLHGRKADFFLFSKFYCGAESTGYCKTEAYQRGRVRLATAMAISGAAASPQMGELLSGTGTFIFTLLNIRLNRWMPNPDPERGLRLRLNIAPYYFIKELFDRGDEKDRMLNLSDGGHIENLALYELIKRRCSLIIVSDAGADPNFNFGDLGNFIRKARIDYGAQITMPLNKLRQLGDERKCELHYAIGTIEYADGPPHGILIYIKASIDGNESEDILAYRRNNETFPDQTTLDQIFEEDQFESYRSLGYQVAKDIFPALPPLLPLS